MVASRMAVVAAATAAAATVAALTEIHQEDLPHRPGGKYHRHRYRLSSHNVLLGSTLLTKKFHLTDFLLPHTFTTTR